jgi:hypothetical protein
MPPYRGVLCVKVVEVQHACPYYDDSYAVNSASMGPWGDAIMHELLPEIESRFRGIGEGWARFTYVPHRCMRHLCLAAAQYPWGPYSCV